MDVSLTPKTMKVVTPSDSAFNVGVGFAVGVAGNIAFEFSDGTQVTWTGVAAGIQYALQFQKIMATNTTATSIVLFN